MSIDAIGDLGNQAKVEQIEDHGAQDLTAAGKALIDYFWEQACQHEINVGGMAVKITKVGA